jgi:hypothetical protein
MLSPRAKRALERLSKHLGIDVNELKRRIARGVVNPYLWVGVGRKVAQEIKAWAMSRTA